MVKRIRARGPTDVINLTAWQMLYGSIPIIIIALLVHSRPIEWTGGFIAALAYNVIPATAMAWVLWLYVLQVLPTGVAGISTLATPVIGIGSAAVVLGERVTAMEGAGMACIIAALLVLAVQGCWRARRPAGGARPGGRPEPAAGAAGARPPTRRAGTGPLDLALLSPAGRNARTCGRRCARPRPGRRRPAARRSSGGRRCSRSRSPLREHEGQLQLQRARLVSFLHSI